MDYPKFQSFDITTTPILKAYYLKLSLTIPQLGSSENQGQLIQNLFVDYLSSPNFPLMRI